MSGQNIEIVKLQIRRGPEGQLPTLDAGEPAITTDTNKIFVGDGTTNHELAHKADLDATNVQLAEISKQFTSSQPTTGTWALADKVWNSNPVSGGNIGWICVQAGTFGSGTDPVFKQFGIISA